MTKFLILSIIANVCLICQRSIASPIRYPCRYGIQQVADLMSSYVTTFKNSVEHNERLALCKNVIEDMKDLKIYLNAMDRCENGGGTRIVRVINEQLSRETERRAVYGSSSNRLFGPDVLQKNSLKSDTLELCAYSLSFVRAMFNLAVKSTAYFERSAPNDVTKGFKTQIKLIDNICKNFEISINANVHFEAPWGGNKIVPMSPQLVVYPLESSQYRFEAGSSDEES
uniref:Uncharacterized protein n=1 Tax=Globodera pallida TaxID=36090 RepID=A0A183CNW2_GLOPA